MMKKRRETGNTIAQNRRARFDYSLDERFEAGLVLTGWEVRALRASRAELLDTHVFVQKGEAFLTGARISPLGSASTHVVAEPERTRKLLLHKREIDKIRNAVEIKGRTCVPTRIYWKGNRVKCELALATGKKLHDKRAAIREREWSRDKMRLAKQYNR